MKRNLAQNRLAIEIACQCLNTNGFAKVARNKHQGTFPHTYVTATDTRSGVEYLIGITSRVEVGADGKLNPAYNVVHSAADRKRAKALAKDMKRTLAFIAIVLRETNGSYAAFFGELAPLDFPIEVPMLPHDRLRLGVGNLALSRQTLGSRSSLRIKPACCSVPSRPGSSRRAFPPKPKGVRRAYDHHSYMEEERKAMEGLASLVFDIVKSA